MRTVACHKETSADDLRQIFGYYNNSYAYDPRSIKGRHHWTVLSCLAANPQAPSDILIAMLPIPGLEAAMSNPGLPRAALTQFLERQSRGDESSRLHAAACRHSTPEILERLASDPDPFGSVRMAVVRNPSTPSRTIEKMVRDSDFRIVEVARNRLIRELDAGDPTLAHRLAASHSTDYQLLIAAACHRNTTTEDLRLIFQQSSGHYGWVYDSLVNCLDEHPDAPRAALLSLHH